MVNGAAWGGAGPRAGRGWRSGHGVAASLPDRHEARPSSLACEGRGGLKVSILGTGFQRGRSVLAGALSSCSPPHSSLAPVGVRGWAAVGRCGANERRARDANPPASVLGLAGPLGGRVGLGCQNRASSPPSEPSVEPRPQPDRAKPRQAERSRAETGHRASRQGTARRASPPLDHASHAPCRAARTHSRCHRQPVVNAPQVRPTERAPVTSERRHVNVSPSHFFHFQVNRTLNASRPTGVAIRTLDALCCCCRPCRCFVEPLGAACPSCPPRRRAGVINNQGATPATVPPRCLNLARALQPCMPRVALRRSTALSRARPGPGPGAGLDTVASLGVPRGLSIAPTPRGGPAGRGTGTTRNRARLICQALALASGAEGSSEKTT